MALRVCVLVSVQWMPRRCKLYKSYIPWRKELIVYSPSYGNIYVWD